MKPFFSVVIPARNEHKYIASTIKQFACVKRKFGIEVIVVDGRSEDDTFVLAKRLADKALLEPHKSTIGGARNEGAKHAKGEVLVFLDSDVRLASPDKFFARMKELFQDERVSASTIDVEVYPEEERFYDGIFHRILNASAFLTRGARGECQVVRRRSFVSVGGYRSRLAAGEDFNLFQRLDKVGKIVYCWDLKAYESPRHFRKRGYLWLFAKYCLNYMFTLLFRKSYDKEWEQVR